MEEIGKKLQNKRRQLKLSYEQVAKITKMPASHIRAIENGDFDYFKDDITYLRFYIKAYCKALDVPYEDIRDDFAESYDEYTNTMSMSAIKEKEVEHDLIEKSIQKNAGKQSGPILQEKNRKSISDNVNSSTRFRKGAKRIEPSLISLIVVVLIVVALIIFGAVHLLNNNGSSDTKTDQTTEMKTPTPEKEAPKETPKEPEEKKNEDNQLKIEETSNGVYNVTGLKVNEEYKIKITYNYECWTYTSLNGTNGIAELTNTFGPNLSGEYTGVAKETKDEFTIKFANYQYNEITINGTKVNVPKTNNTNTLATIIINITGEK